MPSIAHPYKRCEYCSREATTKVYVIIDLQVKWHHLCHTHLQLVGHFGFKTREDAKVHAVTLALTAANGTPQL